MSIEKLKTYVNRNGLPMIRRCFNCKNWDSNIDNNDKKAGYCKSMPLHFAFTLQPTVFAITKDFYLCESHEFKNEQRLSKVCEEILLKDCLKKKDEIS